MGFAAEIKEFLGAAKESWKLMSDTERSDAQTKLTNVKAAAEQKEMDDPLNAQLKEAKLAQMLKSTANIGRETPTQALQRQYWQLQLDAAKNPPQETGPSVGAVPPARVVGAAPARVVPDEVPAIGGGFKRGGLVRKFAVGGIVEDEDLEEEVTPEVMPPAIGGAAPRATEFSAQSRAPAVGGVPLPRGKPNALTDALKYGISELPPAAAVGMPGGARSRALQGMARGAGGAPQNEMLKIFRKIDPNGEMGESERNMYALQAVHEYKMKQNDPEGAAKTAFQMLQTFKTAATQYAALSAVAMKEGHVDEGIKLAMKAYANVPDGNDMKLYRGKDGRIGWEAKDKDGNPISGGIATPEEIGAAAAKLATPGGFENHLVQMTSGAKIKGAGGAGGAGGKKADEDIEGEAGGGFKTSKPSDYRELKQEQVDKAVDDWNTAQQADPESKGKALTPKELASTKNMLFHLRANNQITDDEGLRRIRTIVTADAPTKKGDIPAFKAVENKEAKTHTLLFPDGGELVVPNTQMGIFRSARAELMAERAKEAKKAADDAARPSGWKMFTEGVSEKADEVGADLSKRASAVAEANPEFAARAGSAVRDVKHLVGEAGEWLKKDLAKHPLRGEGLTGGADVYGNVNRAVGGAANAIGGAIVPPAVAYEPNPEDRPL